MNRTDQESSKKNWLIMAEKFRHMLPEKVAALQQSMDGPLSGAHGLRQLENLPHLLHQISNTAATCGFQEITTRARQLENLVDTLLTQPDTNGPSPDDIRRGFQQLKDEMDRVYQNGQPSMTTPRIAGMSTPDTINPLDEKFISGNLPLPDTKTLTAKKPIILIGDDDPMLREMIAWFLDECGYQIIKAENGKQAVEKFLELPVDLVLLDAEMPVMNGFEACIRIKNTPKGKDVPVVMVTILDDKASIEKAFEVGAHDFIHKPIHWTVLKQRLRILLEVRKNETLLKQHLENLGTLVAERTAELNLAKESAEAGIRAKDEFLAIISHEMRTPLNSIIGFSDLLIQSIGGEEEKSWLQMISKSGQLLLELINETLELVEVDSGEYRFQNIPFDLPELLDDIVDTVRPLAQEKKLALGLAREELKACPQQVHGDPKRLRQVLLHLVRNAIKFTDSGSVRLGVKPSVNPNNRTLLHFWVEDTGPGIPANKQQAIFQDFTQLEEYHTRKHEGIGLGLTICKRFIPCMGGKIWVESRVNHGSTFHFTANLGSFPNQ
ncbi:MAG: response regulator [Magnetococcus sp. DMHC-1]|nr:response regulator [Magnetococcales bacterium]